MEEHLSPAALILHLIARFIELRVTDKRKDAFSQ